MKKLNPSTGDSMGNKLVQLLNDNVICLNLNAKDASEVIEHLGTRLFSNGFVKESFIEATLESEKKLPTGLPLSGFINAAIPHSEAVHVVKPGVALATLKQPVVFKNMVKPEEDVNVQLVFMLSLDHPKSQIDMLQQIAGILQHPLTVEKLMSAESFDDVKAALSGS
jgi:galactitol PTS system EIIA component